MRDRADDALGIEHECVEPGRSRRDGRGEPARSRSDDDDVCHDVIPSGGAERRSRGIAIVRIESPLPGRIAIPRLRVRCRARFARNDNALTSPDDGVAPRLGLAKPDDLVATRTDAHVHDRRAHQFSNPVEIHACCTR